MEKLFNAISVIGGVIGGVTAYCFGAWDTLLITVLLLTVLDYVTGLLKAIVQKKLSSEIGFTGIVKKIMMYIVIATAVILGRLTGDLVPLREVVITFFICNEGLSLLENVAEFIPIPITLKNVLLQLRDKDKE